jgi:hypothetical protein
MRTTVSVLAGITEARRKDLNQSRRIHAIPMKKTDQPLVSYLTRNGE